MKRLVGCVFAGVILAAGCSEFNDRNGYGLSSNSSESVELAFSAFEAEDGGLTSTLNLNF